MRHFILLFKYSLVGTLGLMIDVGLLYGLVDLAHLPLLAGSAISFALATLVTFVLNKRWTFRDKSPALSRQLAKFFLVAGTGLLLTLACMSLLVYGLKLWYLPAKLLTSLTVLFWNFSANRYWTFRQEQRHSAVKHVLHKEKAGLSDPGGTVSPSRSAAQFVCALLLALTTMTIMRNRVWQSDWELWRDALDKSPNKGRPHYHYAVLLDKKARDTDALLEYNAALRLAEKPLSGVSLNDMGHIYARLRRYDEAILALQTTLNANPSNDAAYANLGIIYSQLGDPNEALRQFRQALAVNPYNELVRFNMGNLYLDMGLFQEAEISYRTVLQLNPRSADARNNLGMLYGRLGRLNEALTEFSAAIASDPQNAEAFNNLGIVYAKLGRFQEAVSSFQQAMRLGTESAELHKNMGMAYSRAGNAAAAASELERALELEPRYAAVRSELFNLRRELQTGALNTLPQRSSGTLRKN